MRAPRNTTSLTTQVGSTTQADPDLPQYSRAMVLSVWAAATVPMAVLAWVVAPAVAGQHASRERFFVTLLSALTFGLLWQAALVLILAPHRRG